jgi:CheY-like chemotaxis protein
VRNVDAYERPESMKRFHGLVILVVEDDDDARELLQAVLEQRGATVFAAGSVSVAFELFERRPPDVIVSDIAMPDEDGFSLVRRLRSMPADRGGLTPTIAVSAYAGSSDRARALAAGFDRYLHKPVDFDELSATIVSLVACDEDKAIA